MQKLKYELGKPVVEVPHESDECVERRMYKLITAANLQSVFQTEIAVPNGDQQFWQTLIFKAKTHQDSRTNYV